MIDGRVQAEFLKMHIPHPRMSKAHQVYDNLRQMKVLAPNKPQRCACLFAPTQSGKSKTIETYIETKIVDELIAEGLFPADMNRDEIARLQRRALHVTLEGKATPKSAATDILTEFKDPRAAQGTAASLLGRVYHYMRRHGTQILFLDEVQHLDHRQTEKDDKPKRAAFCESTAVTDTLKTMLIRGLVPIVFVRSNLLWLVTTPRRISAAFSQRCTRGRNRGLARYRRIPCRPWYAGESLPAPRRNHWGKMFRSYLPSFDRGAFLSSIALGSSRYRSLFPQRQHVGRGCRAPLPAQRG